MTPEQQLAAAIRSMAYANALALVGFAVLLDNHDVATKEQIAGMFEKLAGLVDGKVPDATNTGHYMLEEVAQTLRDVKAPAPPAVN